MASATNSTTIYAPASSSYGYTLTAYFNENSTNVNANTSNITVTATLSASNISFEVSNAGTLAIYWHDNRENIDVLKNSITLDSCGMNYGSREISATFDATHNDDGNLSGYAYAVWTKARNYTYVPATGSVQTAWTGLTYIPRAATLSMSTYDVTIGNDIISYFTNYVSGFTYTLLVNNITLAQNTTASSITTNTLTTYNFYNFLSASATSTSVTFTLNTYNGSTLVGTDTKSVTIRSNSSHTPTVSISAIDIGKEITDTTKTTLDLTGSNKRIISKWNTMSVVWSATTSGYNTNIASTTINNINATSSPMTLDDIHNSLTIVSTDARGNSKSLTESDLTFIPYETPSIVPTLKRNTATDGHVNLTFTGMFYNIDFGEETNDLTLEWYVREKGTQNYTQGATALTYTENANNTSYVSSATISLVNPLDQVNGLFDYTKAYEFKFVATDLVTSYTISEVLVTGGIPNFVVFKNAVFANGNRIDNNLDTIFPIGKVEVFFDNLDHSNYLGFTWQRKTNAYLYAGSGNAQYGGSNTSGTPSNNETGSTTLTAAQSGLPSHYHDLSTGGYSYNAGIATGAYSIATSDSTQTKDTSAWTATTYAGGNDASQGHTHTLNSHTHSVEPYRIEVSMWVRIA